MANAFDSYYTRLSGAETEVILAMLYQTCSGKSVKPFMSQFHLPPHSSRAITVQGLLVKFRERTFVDI